MLLLVVSRLEDRKLAALGAVPPDLTVIRKHLPSQAIVQGGTSRRQTAARQASLAGRQVAVAADGFDFHVDWYKELHGRLGAKLGSGAFGQVYKVPVTSDGVLDVTFDISTILKYNTHCNAGHGIVLI
jgi:hypothetical protein